MITKFLIPLLSIAGLAFALFTVASGAKPTPVAAPIADPASTPFESTIAGAGIVEAKSQNIAVGTPIAGVVADVPVKVGDVVVSGTPLFRLDDRDRRARLEIEKAALDSAQADLARIVNLPRQEDVPPAEARVAAAESALADARRQLEVAESLDDKRAMSIEEWNRRAPRKHAPTWRRSRPERGRPTSPCSARRWPQRLRPCARTRSNSIGSSCVRRSIAPSCK